MKIEKQINGNELTIKLEGRLDANTVPEVENEISNLDGIEKIVFDFEKLEYISSLGLRVILKCKKLIDSTSIINCNPEVYEVLNITGFTEMMEIEKAFRNISIDNCEKIGEGFFGNIYRIDPETIVKVYKIPDSYIYIKKERELAKKAFVMGIPTAIPYDIVKVGNLYGTVFELLNAKSMVNLINNEEDLDIFAKKCSDVLKIMHSKEVKEGELPNRKETILKDVEECHKYFSEETYEKLIALLNTIPDRNTLLHCDFHVKNIMMQDDDLLLIDMDNLSIGHPIFEFGSIYASYEAFSCVNKKNTDDFLGLPLETTSKLFNKILKYYYENKSDDELEDIKLKVSIISFIQVLNIRSKFTDETCTTREEDIEFCKKYLTEKVDNLDTLEY